MTSGFMLKKPDKTRRSFQIVPYKREAGRKVYGSSLKTPELDALNESLKAGRLSEAACLAEIKSKVLPELKRRARVPEKVAIDSLISESNLKVFKEYWNKEYRRARLEEPSVARTEFLTALRILEPLSLHSSTIDALQDHWDKKERGTRHKRYGNRVNQLLEFLGRAETIKTDRASTPPLKFVTWLELTEMLKYISSEELRLLYQTLWGTGARLGEALAMRPEDVRANGSVYIHRQIDRSKNLKGYTKNKRNHDTIILEEALPAVQAWAHVADKAALRSRCQHPLIDAAKKAFPREREKWISPHKLRASYVKQMLELGVPLYRVAQFLGDLVSTVEAHYKQWVISDAEIEHVREIMSEGYKRLKGSR